MSEGRELSADEARNFYKYEKSIASFVREYIDKRIEQVQANPSLIETGRLTLSTCFYEIRPLLLDAGITFEKSTRKTIQNDYIKKFCEQKGYKRADLGIIAAVRAEFYFKGEIYSVGIDTVSELVDDGTDVLIIEKEGVVEALGPYADNYGVALMYTRGFASEYAKELSETSGANIALLTDFDPAGVMMGLDLPDVERIGIDFHALEYIFGLEPDTMTADSEIVKRLEEEYKQNKVDSHLVSLSNNEHPSVDYFMPDSNNNVRRRIEIDSVLKEIGNERFWDFIIHELEELFPTRNYNRVIDVDEIANIYTDEMFQLQELVVNMIKDVLKDSIKDWRSELFEYRGFIKNISSKELIIRIDFKDIRDNDKKLIKFNKDVVTLIEKYSPTKAKDKTDKQQQPPS